MGGHAVVTGPGVIHGQILFSHVDTNQLATPKKLAAAPTESIDVAALVKKEVQTRRRHMLLGETVDSLRVWDFESTFRTRNPRLTTFPGILRKNGYKKKAVLTAFF